MSDGNEMAGSTGAIDEVRSSRNPETVAGGVDDAGVKQVIEALIFASDEPLSVKLIKTILYEGESEAEGNHPGTDDIASIIASLNEEYGQSQRPYRIVQLAGGYLFATEKKFAGWIGKLVKERARRKLSQTAVETLAIIAYKQPVTKTEIEFIRGVNSDYIVKALLEKNLITIVGRAPTPGRPLLYGTTSQFLIHFGLNEITDLPKPREIEELLGETELEVEKRMLAEQQEISFKEELEEKKESRTKAPHIPVKKSALQEPPSQETQPAVEFPVPAPPSAELEIESKSPSVGGEMNVGILKDSTASIEESPIVEEREKTEKPEALIEEQMNSVHLPPIDETANEDSFSASNVDVDEQNESAFLQPSAVDSEQEAESEPPVAETINTRDIAISGGPETRSQPMGSTEEYQQDTGGEGQKGWSKWKTKIQTFFRKLFG
jgi:segregation and condensation protein B